MGLIKKPNKYGFRLYKGFTEEDYDKYIKTFSDLDYFLINFANNAMTSIINLDEPFIFNIKRLTEKMCIIHIIEYENAIKWLRKEITIRECNLYNKMTLETIAATLFIFILKINDISSHISSNNDKFEYLFFNNDDEEINKVLEAILDILPALYEIILENKNRKFSTSDIDYLLEKANLIDNEPKHNEPTYCGTFLDL